MLGNFKISVTYSDNSVFLLALILLAHDMRLELGFIDFSRAVMNRIEFRIAGNVNNNEIQIILLAVG